MFGNGDAATSWKPDASSSSATRPSRSTAASNCPQPELEHSERALDPPGQVVRVLFGGQGKRLVGVASARRLGSAKGLIPREMSEQEREPNGWFASSELDPLGGCGVRVERATLTAGTVDDELQAVGEDRDLAALATRARPRARAGASPSARRLHQTRESATRYSQ